MLNNGANINHHYDDNIVTAVNFATLWGNLNIIKLLVEYDANCNIPDENGNTVSSTNCELTAHNVAILNTKN